MNEKEIPQTKKDHQTPKAHKTLKFLKVTKVSTDLYIQSLFIFLQEAQLASSWAITHLLYKVRRYEKVRKREHA